MKTGLTGVIHSSARKPNISTSGMKNETRYDYNRLNQLVIKGSEVTANTAAHITFQQNESSHSFKAQTHFNYMLNYCNLDR